MLFITAMGHKDVTAVQRKRAVSAVRELGLYPVINRLKNFIAVIAKHPTGKIASAAFLIIQERPTNPSFITGLTGTLLNVVTYPEFRRKGIASQVIGEIINEARQKGVSSIDLYATDDGKELYKKLGFVEPSYTSMRLKL